MQTELPQWTVTEQLFFQSIRKGAVARHYLEAWLETNDVSEIDWEDFSALAKRHRVEALLSENLGFGVLRSMPDDIAQMITQVARRQVLQALNRQKATIEVVRLFAEHKIKTILMKSDAISLRIFDVPSHRFSKDIDFWISIDDFDRASSLLLGLGYEPEEPEITIPDNCLGVVVAKHAYVDFVHPQTGVSVELHWRLLTNPSLLPIDFSDACKKAEMVELGGTYITTFNNPMLLVYLMCHGGEHYWFRAKWLCDIDRLLGHLNDEEMKEAQEIAEFHNVTGLFKCGLAMQRIIFERDPPFPTIQSMGVSWPLARYALQRLAQRGERLQHHIFDVFSAIKEQREVYRLHPRPQYLFWMFIIYVLNMKDVERLKLSRKWLWVYVISGALSLPFRATARYFKRLSE